MPQWDTVMKRMGVPWSRTSGTAATPVDMSGWSWYEMFDEPCKRCKKEHGTIYGYCLDCYRKNAIEYWERREPGYTSQKRILDVYGSIEKFEEELERSKEKEIQEELL